MVLGATGAVGSAVVRRAAEAGREVHAIVRKGARLDRIESFCDRVVLHEVDELDADALDTAMDRSCATGIVCAAFPPGFATDMERRRRDAQSMLALAFALVGSRAWRNAQASFVLVGSATSYGAGQSTGTFQPHSFRGALKACESVLLHHAAREAGVRFVEMRLFTAYGPYEQRDRFLPALMRAALCGEQVALPLEPRFRDWVHMEDVAEACIQAASDAGVLPTAVDLCSGTLHSLEHCVQVVERLAGLSLRSCARFTGADRYGQVDAGRLPTSTLFSWRPRLTLEQGLAQYWSWAQSAVGRRHLLTG